MSDVNNAPQNHELQHPFGLPLGTIRGFLSLLICAFFWMIMLWPQKENAPTVKIMLGHFFLLSLVFMAFASHPNLDQEKKKPILPWVLRFLFVGGSILVVVVSWVRNANVLRERLTPKVEEFSEWWLPFLGIMAFGFAVGIILRFVMGRGNHIFRTIRAWLSIVAMILLIGEFALFIGLISAENKPFDLLQYWQATELAVVAAYFGSRT